MVAKVLIDNASQKLNKVYDYLVPDNLVKDVEVGKRVLVNFGQGKGRQVEGIVVKLLNKKDDENYSKLKVIDNVLDQENYLNEKRLKLAKWMSKMYFCNVYTALKLMLPSDSNKLKEKTLKVKQIKVVTLNCSNEIIKENIESKKITSAKHIRLLKELENNSEIPVIDIVNGLGISKSIIKTVEQKGYIKIINKDIEIEDYSKVEKSEKLVPTSEQKIVIDSLINKLSIGKFNVSLLNGITGSGKTEVYLQAIEECLRLNKTAIVLVPEISLTYQTKLRFISRFSDVVSVLHSKMTPLERNSEYKRIVTGKAKIVIGPRSALFVPLKNIGLIIMDEEHDTSYISSTTPKYNTKEVATRIAYDNNALLLLGSATPDICTMYKAKQGKIDYYEMLNRPSNSCLPKMEIVDMKEEALINKSKILSTRLKEEIEKNIKSNEQTFIFLNRRGFSSYVVCGDCGKILKCPNCDVNLIYHKKNGLLLCHYCSYCETLKNVCPICGSESLKLNGIGTEKVEEELKETFNNISILRMDMDTTVKKGSHEEILNKFKNENVDVLVGTQMIAKGHDIENVTLVGIINADITFGEDYNAQEKTFSSLLQVSGRAGRGKKQGRVIMQAADTDSYVLNAVYNNSYMDFYEKEIEFRKLANYPPFVDILVVEIVSKNKEILTNESKKLYDIFSRNDKKLYKVYSPKVPYVGKVNNKYKIQMVIKTKISDKVLDLIYENLNNYDKIKNRNVNISVTKNPVKIG